MYFFVDKPLIMALLLMLYRITVVVFTYQHVQI